MNYKDFYAKYKGKAIDADGVYGAQCVDLFKIYLKELGDKNYARALGGDGYAGRIYDRFEQLKYDKYFTKVSKNNLKVGDWIIWDKHVGLIIEKNGNIITVFGQNQNGKSYGNNIKMNVFDDIGAGPLLGGLRLKTKKKTKKKKTEKEHIKVAKKIWYGPNTYGNGKKRKEKLEKEGYNYNKVQGYIERIAGGEKL